MDDGAPYRARAHAPSRSQPAPRPQARRAPPSRGYPRAGTTTSLRPRPDGPRRRPTGPRRLERRPPRWTRWTLNTLIVLLVVGILVAGGGYFYLRHQVSQISRIDIPDLIDQVPGQPMNVLVVGSDSRERVQGDLADATGRGQSGTAGRRSDSMMVMHINPEATSAAVLGIPRDLWVNIPGYGNERINAAYAFGGAPLLVQTIRNNLGITINHYVEVDFVGFSSIVDTVGGVDVFFENPARDPVSGLDVPEAGCIRMDGYHALALVRSRGYQSLESGRWVFEGASDFGRIERQQDFVRRMIRKAVSSGLTNPLTLNRLVGIGVDNVTLDSGMSTGDILRLAKRFSSFDSEAVDMFTVPATGFTTAGGAQVLRINLAEAQPLIDRINGIEPPAPPRPTDTRVRVLNGNGTEGAAGTTALALEGVGFSVGEKGDASSFSHTRTEVRFAPGQREKAQLLASYLASGAMLTEDATLARSTVDLALIVGRDYSGVRPGPAGPAVNVATAGPVDDAPEPAPAAGAASC